MPVDLSRVGLEGIETGQRTLNSIAARESQALQDRIKLGEFEREEAELALDRLAVDNAKKIMAGEGRDITSPEATEDDMARFLALAGSNLAAAGAPKRGKEMMEASLDLLKKRADINKTADDHAKVRLDNMVKASDYMYQMLSDSLNESEYQFNLANIPDDIAQILGPENVETLKNTPWSPELIDYFKTKALSVKDQAQLELQARGQRRAEQTAEDARRFREIALNLQKRRVEAAERAEAAARKAGGNAISKAPTGDERKTAEAIIANIIEADGGKLDDASAFHLVEDVISEAKQLVAESPGLTFGEAVTRAAMAAKGRGDFEVTLQWRGLGPIDFTDKKPVARQYKPQGRSKETPAPLPKGTPDQIKGSLVKGRYYQTAKGILRWNGSAFDAE